VSWIEATGNYVQLHASGQAFLMRTTMADLEEQLDPTDFARVHRTAIVNLNRVQEILTSEHGDHTIRLDDGTAVRLSRTYRSRVFSHLYRGRQAEE
jgi:two-component system, LytTR family, response regulator